MREVLQFLTTCRDISRDDICKLVDDFTESGNLVRALVMLHAECALRPLLQQSEVAMWLEKRASKIFEVSRSLIDEEKPRKREIAVEYGIKKMEDLLTDFRQITGVYPKIRNNLEMSWLNDLAHLYDSIEQRKVSRRYSQEALKIIEKRFVGHEFKNHFYGYVLHNIGTSFAKDGEIQKAESYFVRSMNAYKNTTGSASVTKGRWVETCETNLKKVRQKKHHPKGSRK